MYLGRGKGTGGNGWGECVFDDCILFQSGLSNATNISVPMNKVLLCCVMLISSSQHTGGKGGGGGGDRFFIFNVCLN